MDLRLRQSRDNWSQLKGMAPEKRVQHRDVYGDQQLQRSEMGEMQTMTTRLIFVWFCAIMAFICVWVLVSLGQFLLVMANGGGYVPDSSGTSSFAIVTDVSAQSSSSGVDGGFVEVDSSAAASSGNSSEGNDWDTIFDDELPLEGDAVDDSVPGVDAAGSSVPTSEGYAVARGLTYEQFRDRYFSADSNGGFVTMYVNRVTGARMTSSGVYDLWVSVTGGDQVAYSHLYGDTATIVDAAPSGGSGSTEDVGVGGGDSSQVVDRPVVSDSDPSGSSGSEAPSGVGVVGSGSDGSTSRVPGSESDESARTRSLTPKDLIFRFTFGKFVLSFLAAAVVWLIMYEIMKKNLDAQNAEVNVTDINQYPNDQHIALPEEVQIDFDWFPDVGAHSPVQVSSMISHMALQNKGLKQVQVTRRAEKDMKDKSGEVVYLKGEVLLDTDGQPIQDTRPMIDEKFSEALFEASGVLKPKRGGFNFRRRFDATKIPYNPGNKNRNKLKDAETVADMINKYWTFPQYEPQRPSGAYIVDTDPVNTIQKRSA